MADVQPPDPLRRAQLYEQIVNEGRRRVRRRSVAVSAGAIVVAATAGGLVSHPWTTSNSRAVSTYSPRTAISASCSGGGPPRPGVARVGMSVAFGWLPPGLKTEQVSSGSSASATAGTGQPGSSTQVTVEAQVGDELPQGEGTDPSARQVTIDGHGATLDGPFEKGTEVAWQPHPDETVTVSGYQVTADDVLSVARHLILDWGVTAPSVGDLGPVVPRSTILAYADPPGSEHASRVLTWLVTWQEYAEAQALHGGSTPEPLPENIDDSTPLWVVVMIGSVRGHVQQTVGITPAGEGHVAIGVFNAITGEPLELGGEGGNATVPAYFATLVDHSTDQPCPAPSSTEPDLQRALPGPNAYQQEAALPARVTGRGFLGGEPYIQIDAGTNQGLARGDVVTTVAASPDQAPDLVGTITSLGATSAQVGLVTGAGSSVPVRLDPTGYDGVAVGHGPGQRLTLTLANPAASLHVGQQITTAGPPDSTYPPGIVVGTLTSATNGVPSDSGTIAIPAAANPATIGSVEVLLHSA